MRINMSWNMIIFLIFTILVAINAEVRLTSNRRLKKSMLDAEPCLDIEEVKNDDKNKLVLSPKFSHLREPWIRDDGTSMKLLEGEGIRYQWAWMKALQIKGLKSKTIEDVTQFLDSNRCLFIPVGPFVRDIVLRNQPVRLSGEVSCDIKKIYSLCKEKFGSRSCSLFPIEGENGKETYRLEIGDSTANTTIYQIRAEPIQIYEWRTILGRPTDRWGFTVDTMAIYDNGAGDTFLIDPFDKGFKDTCDKKLEPTDENWDKWSDNQMLKVLEFYNLRNNGFSVGNSEFQTFVNEHSKLADMKTAQTFYCETILKGIISMNENTPICHTIYPESESNKRISSIRTLMIKEMGNSWNDTIGKAGDTLEAVYCTTKQFLEVRNRLKHKFQSNEESSEEEIEPKQIVEGKPMITDLNEVHARPIQPMNEEQPELPHEFPSLPNVKLDDNLVFIESNEPEIAGYNDPVAYEVSKELQESDDDPVPMIATIHVATESTRTKDVQPKREDDSPVPSVVVRSADNQSTEQKMINSSNSFSIFFVFASLFIYLFR